MGEQLAGGSGPLASGGQQLQQQLQTQASRSRQMAAEHAEYEQQQAAQLAWLEAAQRTLQQNSPVVGQLAVLTERRRRLEELSDEWCRRSAAVEQALSLGERLYAQTAPLGRETIRAQNTEVRGGCERLATRSRPAVRS